MHQENCNQHLLEIVLNKISITLLNTKRYITYVAMHNLTKYERKYITNHNHCDKYVMQHEYAINISLSTAPRHHSLLTSQLLCHAAPQAHSLVLPSTPQYQDFSVFTSYMKLDASLYNSNIFRSKSVLFMFIAISVDGTF